LSGYTRQDLTGEIATGQIVEAAPLNAEFNAITTAFSAASGHTHSGLTGEGPPITVVGPAQDVTISVGSMSPKTDNTLDLGSATFEYKDLWIDGTANIDTLAADAGTVGGSTIATLTQTQTLTNKTIDLTNNTLVATSAQLAAAVTDETGTGALVFAVSPALTGTPTAPTAVDGTATTQVATTAFVNSERSNLFTLTNKTIDLGSNTLSATSAQLAAAVSDETGTGALVFANSPVLAGVPAAPTAAGGNNSTQIATTAFVGDAVQTERSAAVSISNKDVATSHFHDGTLDSVAGTNITLTGTVDIAMSNTGSAGTPAIRFDPDTNTGIYQPSNNTWAVSVDGTQRFKLSTVDAEFTVPVQAPVGSLAAPSLSFITYPSTGLYATAAGCVASANGQQVANFTDSQLYITQPITGEASRYIELLARSVGGTANAITLTSSGLSSLVVGQQVRFLASAANTTTATIALDGHAALSALTVTGDPLPAGYIRNDAWTTATYTGSSFLLTRDPEYDSNANGSYWRYADGLQICIASLSATSIAISTAFVGGFRSSEQTWTLPASFIAVPTLTGTAKALSAFGVVETGNTSASLGRFIWTAVTSQAAADRSAHLMAIGRWY